MDAIRSTVNVATGIILVVALAMATIPALAQAQAPEQTPAGRQTDVFVTNDEANAVPVTGEVSVVNHAGTTPYQYADLLIHDEPGVGCFAIPAAPTAADHALLDGQEASICMWTGEDPAAISILVSGVSHPAP